MSNRAKEIAAIMATYEPGQEWQYRALDTDIWINLDAEPIWDWSQSEYRRKPEPKYRPWTPDEAIGKAIKSKSSGVRYVIVSACDLGYSFGEYSSKPYTWSDLLSRFTQLDGSPCGVLETPTTN